MIHRLLTLAVCCFVLQGCSDQNVQVKPTNPVKIENAKPNQAERKPPPSIPN